LRSPTWSAYHGSATRSTISRIVHSAPRDRSHSAGPQRRTLSLGSWASLSQIEECLAAVRDTAEVVAAYFACAWLPDRIGDQAAREVMTRLVTVLGTDLRWP
jgi:hypothetical protein